MSTLQILIIISFIILVLLCFYLVVKCKQIPEPIYRTVALNDQGKIVVLSIDWWTFSPLGMTLEIFALILIFIFILAICICIICVHKAINKPRTVIDRIQNESV